MNALSCDEARQAMTFVVGAEDTIAAIEPSLPPVLGSDVLVRWMETAAARLVAPGLGADRLSIGARIDIEHLRPAPEGARVEVVATLIESGPRDLHYEIVASDGRKDLARARHHRTIVRRAVIERVLGPERPKPEAPPSELELDGLRERFRDIALRFPAELLATWNERGVCRPLWTELADADMFRLLRHEEDGPGLARLSAALEGLTEGSKDGGLSIAVISHAALCLPALRRYGSPSVQARYVERLESGECSGALAITEPQGGSEALDVRTTLTPLPEGGYRLDGGKWHVTNAPVAGVIITFASMAGTDEVTAVVVDPSWKGVSRSAALECMGMRGSPVGSIEFDGVQVPADHLLGKPGQGKRILKDAFALERLLAPWSGVGSLKCLLGEVLDYMSTRKVGGHKLTKYQFLQLRATDMRIALDRLEGLARNALSAFMEGRDSALEASMAKMEAMEAVREASTHAIKIFGSYGLQERHRFAHLLLDSVAGSIAGGTEEIHRRVIFSKMLTQRAKQRRRRRQQSSPRPHALTAVGPPSHAGASA